MKKFNYGAKGWGIVIFCFFLFWVGSGCPVTSLNVIMSEYNAMYGWDIAVLNGFGTMANILSIIAAAVFGWWCKKRGPKSLILAGCIMGGCINVYVGTCYIHWYLCIVVYHLCYRIQRILPDRSCISDRKLVPNQKRFCYGICNGRCMYGWTNLY